MVVRTSELRAEDLDPVIKLESFFGQQDPNVWELMKRMETEEENAPDYGVDEYKKGTSSNPVWVHVTDRNIYVYDIIWKLKSVCDRLS